MKSRTDGRFLCLQRTRLGALAVIWSFYRGEPKIIRILLSDPRVSAKQKAAADFPDARPSSHPKIKVCLNQMERFLKGTDIRFSLSAVRLDLCTDFQRTVLRAGYNIPRGKVGAYRFIAKQIGLSRSARAVGTALASNPFPVMIPCHRVVCSNGAPGGYQGGPKMKRALLKMEKRLNPITKGRKR